MKLSAAIAGGVTGATALTLLHETLKRIDQDAPRMDLLGMDAVSKILRNANTKLPEDDKLFNITMAGDLLSNSLYYTFAGIGKGDNALIQGTLLGVAAGLGAVYLPKPMGLKQSPSNRTLKTKALTVSLYLFGGVVAGLAGKFFSSKIKN